MTNINYRFCFRSFEIFFLARLNFYFVEYNLLIKRRRKNIKLLKIYSYTMFNLLVFFIKYKLILQV